MNGVLHSINQSHNSSNVDVEFIIHGFGVSRNNAIVTEELCREYADTIINKPILCKYYYNGDSNTDHFGDHEVYLTTNRETGEDMIETDTIAIGVFNGWRIDDVNGERVFIGKGVMWGDRYSNAVGYLIDMNKRGVNIRTSCEYLYRNYSVKDGVRHIEAPIEYDGHCILNSEVRDGDVEYGVVEPAYIESRLLSLNQAIQIDISNDNTNDVDNINNNKEMEAETVEEIKNEVVEVVEEPTETVETVEETPVVEEQEVEEVETVVEETTVEETVESATEEQVEEEPQVDLQAELVAAKENEVALNETIVNLNARIKELENCEKELNEIKYAEKLVNAKAEYEAKFAKFNAKETFESDEVQGLIADSLDTEKSLDAKLKLAEIMLNCVEVVEVVEEIKEDADIVVTAKSLNNLLPKSIDYVNQYGFSVNN